MTTERIQIEFVIHPAQYRSAIPYHRFRADALLTCAQIVGSGSMVIKPRLHPGDLTNTGGDGRYVRENIYLTKDNILAIVSMSRVPRGEKWEVDIANVELFSNNTSVPLEPLKDRLETAVRTLYESRFQDK